MKVAEAILQRGEAIGIFLFFYSPQLFCYTVFATPKSEIFRFFEEEKFDEKVKKISVFEDANKEKGSQKKGETDCYYLGLTSISRRQHDPRRGII